MSLIRIMSKIKTLFGETEVKSVLGTSSLGKTYLVKHPEHDLCALKILQGKVAFNEKFLLRFLRELGTNCKTFHPGVAEIIAILKDENYFILRKYVPGESLREKIQEQKYFSIDKANQFLLQLIEILNEFCENNNVALKNLKPNNIIINNENIVITDYSLPPTVAHYLSPEQCMGKKSQTQSDIYTLGAIYYYCLTGANLFEGSYKEVMQGHVKQKHPSITHFAKNLPVYVDSILQKMLHKEPQQRYLSYSDIIKDIKPHCKKVDSSLDFGYAGDSNENINIVEGKTSHSNIETTRRIAKKINEAIATPKPKKRQVSIEAIVKDLEKITNIETLRNDKYRPLKSSYHIPADFKNEILFYLQEKFPRRCWIFNSNENLNEIEIEINLEEALVLDYLHSLKSKLKKIIHGYQNINKNISLKQQLPELQNGNVEIAIGEFIKEANYIEKESSFQKRIHKSEYANIDNFYLEQKKSENNNVNTTDQKINPEPSQTSNKIPIETNHLITDATITNDEVAQETDMLVGQESFSTANEEVTQQAQQSKPDNFLSDITVASDEVAQHAQMLTEKRDNFKLPDETLVSDEVSQQAQELTSNQEDNSDSFVADATLMSDEIAQQAQQLTSNQEDNSDSFVADATLMSDEIAQQAQQLTSNQEDNSDSFVTDATLMSDEIAQQAQMLTEKRDNFKLPDETLVSDEVAQHAQELTSNPDNFLSDMTVTSDEVAQHAQMLTEKRDNFKLTDETLVSDEVAQHAQELTSNPDNFLSDMTVTSDEVAQQAQMLTEKRDNFKLPDETLVSDEVAQHAQELTSNPDNFLSDMTVTSDEVAQQAQMLTEKRDNFKLTDETLVSDEVAQHAQELTSNPDNFLSDITVTSDEVAQHAQMLTEKSNNFKPTDETLVSDEVAQHAQELTSNPDNFLSDITVTSDEVAQHAQMLTEKSNNFKPTDETLVSDEVAQHAQELTSNPDNNSFVTDATLVSNDIIQQAEKLVSDQDSNDSLAMDVTLMSDEIAQEAEILKMEILKENQDSSNNFKLTDATLVNSEIVDGANTLLKQNDLATDVTLVSKSIQAPFPQKEGSGKQKQNTNDVLIEKTEVSTSAKNSETIAKVSRPTSAFIVFKLDCNNQYEALSWGKFVEENHLKKEKDYKLICIKEPKIYHYAINMDWALQYYELEQKSSLIKDFFQSDYEITELGRGGMGMVLKLTTKYDATILSIRPENNWAREYFTEYLCVRKRENNEEIVYAELPAGKSFVVKVAFKGYEESLIREGGCLEKIAQHGSPQASIVGLIQQGCLMARDKEDSTHLGYYVMMEYGGDLAANDLSEMFPDNKLPLMVTFTLFYGLTQALVELNKEGIIHRDIKPHNVLLTDSGIPKLFDFGLAITSIAVDSTLNDERRRLLRVLDNEFLYVSTECEFIQKKLHKLYEQKINIYEFDEEVIGKIDEEISLLEEQYSVLSEKEKNRAFSLQHLYCPTTAEENAKKGSFAGSLYYAAPEQFQTSTVLNHQCDVYQLGSLIYTLLTGKKTVHGKNMSELLEHILFREKPQIKNHMPQNPLVLDLSDLVSKMMKNNRDARIHIDEVQKALNKILFTHLDDLMKPLVYGSPNVDDVDSRGEYYRKIAFAQKMFMKCLKNLHLYVDKLEKEQNENKKVYFNCPSCLKNLHVTALMVGKKGVCPKCKHPIVVKMQESENE